jgi:hypothetical protein
MKRFRQLEIAACDGFWLVPANLLDGACFCASLKTIHA